MEKQKNTSDKNISEGGASKYASKSSRGASGNDRSGATQQAVSGTQNIQGGRNSEEGLSSRQFSGRSESASGESSSSVSLTGQNNRGNSTSVEWIDQLVARTEGFEEKVQDLIQARPLTFLAGALVVGFITNKVMNSRFLASKLQGEH